MAFGDKLDPEALGEQIDALLPAKGEATNTPTPNAPEEER